MKLDTTQQAFFKKCFFVLLLMARPFAGSTCCGCSFGFGMRMSVMYGVELFPDPELIPQTTHMAQYDVFFQDEDLNDKARLIKQVTDWYEQRVLDSRVEDLDQKVQVKILALKGGPRKTYRSIYQLKSWMEHEWPRIKVSIIPVDQATVLDYHQIMLGSEETGFVFNIQSNTYSFFDAIETIDDRWERIPLLHDYDYHGYYYGYTQMSIERYIWNKAACLRMDGNPRQTKKPKTPLAQFTEIRSILIEPKNEDNGRKWAA